MTERNALPIPNNRLREHRERLFGTQEELAIAANQLLPAQYLINGNYIGKLERGEINRPGLIRRQALRTVCKVSTDAEVGFDRRRQSDPPNAAAVQAPPHGGAPAQAQDDVGMDLVELASSLAPQGMGTAELTATELACERLDLEFAQQPPDEVLARIRMLLKHVAISLQRPQSLRHHERLVTLTARLAGLRAWACFDIDEHSESDRWYEIAVSAAHEARAWGLGAWLLGAQSLIPWHRRDLGRTIELIERGIYFASQGSDATTRAWLYALHARGNAGRGNSNGFNASYSLAEEAAEYSSERDRRHGMDFAEGAIDLRYYSGTSRLLLRQPDRARPELTGSLTALPPSHTKARAVLGLFIADAAAQSNDAAEAMNLAHQALTSTIHQPIVPVLQQARRVRRLIQQIDPTAAEDLNDPIHDFGRALTAIADKAKP